MFCFTLTALIIVNFRHSGQLFAAHTKKIEKPTAHYTYLASNNRKVHDKLVNI